MDNFIEEDLKFTKQIGLIFWPTDIAALGLEPYCDIGGFYKSKLGVLFEFVEKNSSFLIVTCKGPNMYNRYEPNGHGYYIADGDPDPSLVHDICASVELAMESLSSKTERMNFHRCRKLN